MLTLRNAREADLETILRIYETARQYMIASGNPDQWGHSFPPEDIVRADIEKASVMFLPMRTACMPCLC